MQAAAVLTEAWACPCQLNFIFLSFLSRLSLAKSIQVCFLTVEAKMMKTAFEHEVSMVREQTKRHLKGRRREIDFVLHLNVQHNQ